MFRIRTDHVEAFRSGRLINFLDRALRHLRRDLPKQVAKLSDDEIRQQVSICIRRAAAFGLKSEQQAMCFVDTSFLLGIDFDENPQYGWSRQLLKSDKLSATDKAHLLLATACSIDSEKNVAKAKA